MRSVRSYSSLVHVNVFKGLLSVLCLLVLALYAQTFVTTSAQEREDAAAVAQAWARARETGAYRYTADIVQTTVPKPTVTNVGQTSRRNAVYLEGESDLAGGVMDLRLWANGGRVDDASASTEVRVEGDRAYARQGGGEWEEIDNFAGLFAPQGDFMAFLAAAQDVTSQGVETRQIAPLSPISFTRYTFRVNGLSYARYLRDQIQQQMAETGELPPSVDLDLPRQYVDMNGEGELWIGADGLPMRQIVHLQMPERPDAQVEASITVDFYFDAASGAKSAKRGLQALYTHVTDPRTTGRAMLFVSLLALVGVLVAHSRSKRFYTALALFVIASMILTPLLQSVHAANFSDRQAERAREQEQREAEEQKTHDARQLQSSLTLSGQPHNPNRPPLDLDPLPALQTRGAFASTDPMRVTADDLRFNCQDDDGTDSDGDGLTDCQEELLGTNPYDADTDGDTITDTLEVQGFFYGGKMWYTDPLEMDTNKDGISDMHEWNWQDSEHTTWDTDGDGVPDLFDLDNDGDGVPDNLDLSPMTANETVFSDKNPLLLQINNLEAGKPTYVEFQLRPTNPDHLWYAMNVLDWPLDHQAQMQDADGKTFHDVDPNTALSPNANGDLKLVPMLEIRISGQRTNLPPQSELDHYGVFVTDMNQSGSDKAVYVPLNLVIDYDDDGRARSRVAFYGKMLYRPEMSWGGAQQVRLVWLLQALVDRCAEGGYEDGICKTYETYNEMQVIHVYYEDWTLTGLQVREDHGVDVAFVYEDPAVDADLHDDGVLFALASAFDYTFLAARDADGDGQRDITTAEIYRRFDHATNAVITEEERWGITNTLSVALHSYEHLDEALITIAMTDTKALLESVFTPHWSESAPITPTLMFVREERARTANLDVEGRGDIIVWDGAQLAVDLPTSGDGGLQVMTVGGVRWSPYRFRAGWEGCPIDKYWEELEQRYPYSEQADPEVAAGMMYFTQLLYLSLYQGVDSMIQLGDTPLTNALAYEDASVLVTVGVSGGALAAKFIINKVIEQIVNGILSKLGKEAAFAFSDTARFFKLLGLLKLYNTVAEWGKDLVDKVKIWAENLTIVKELKWAFGKDGWVAGVGLVVAGIGFAVLITGLVALVVWELYKAGILAEIIDSVKGLVAFFQDVYQVQWIKDMVNTATIVFKFVTPVIKFLVAIYTAMTTTMLWAGLVSLIFEVIVIWIIFFIQCGVAKIAPGSVAFNMLLAQTIAATVLAILTFLVTVILAALVGTGWGIFIAAIIALVIGVIEGIGAIFGFSLTEWVTNTLAKVLYNVRPMVTTSVDIQPLSGGSLLLSNPARGFEEGNQVRVAMRVNTVLNTNRLAWWQYFTNTFCWRFFDSDDYFDMAAFKYALDHGKPSSEDPNALVPQGSFPKITSEKIEWHSTLMPSLDEVIPYYAGFASQDVELKERVPLVAGVNRSLPVLFLTSYSVPVIEYVQTGYYFYACWTRAIEGEVYSDAGIVYDVFPSSLDGFYDLERMPNDGYRLSWDPAFDILWDADGDGLRSAAYDGPDPNDGAWDTDGDGLSDAYELELRQAGIDISPLLADTDGDGLSDAEELRLGTDPTRPDTDGDGLEDGVEVNGWAFTFGVAPTHTVTSGWATSDPLIPDTDGDGMSDLTEWTLHQTAPDEYALHPRVPNPSPIAIYAAIGDDDGVVAAGATVPYTAAVQNNLTIPLYSVGELTIRFPPILDQSDIFENYTLFMGEAITIAANMHIDESIPSQRLAISNQMASQLTGNPACANIRFKTLRCVTENDVNPGPYDYYPPGSEVSILFDHGPWGSLWNWDASGVTAGANYALNAVVPFCNQKTIQVWECDWWPGCTPTILEQWTVDAQVQGDFTRAIDDLPAEFTGSLDYSIYYAGGDINLSEVVPIIIDADAPTTAALTSLSDGQYVRGAGETLIIGGIAQDPTSSIASVEVSVDGGDWDLAAGAESWAYAWAMPAQAGPYTFRTRATDVVGHTFTEANEITVIVDIYPPDVSTPIVSGDIVTATRNASGRWNVALHGVAQDRLDFGGDPGSGVYSVQALLEGANRVAGQGWQTATLTALGGNNWGWHLDYVLPALNNDSEVLSDPSGEYNFVVRATDHVGNVTHSSLNILLRIDSAPPVATISDTGPSTTTITQSLTIAGVITDPGVVAAGLSSLEIAYTPQDIATTFSPADVRMLLHLDEAPGVTIFRDAVGDNHGLCTGSACPTTGESGQHGLAARFDGVNDFIRVPDDDQLNFGPDQDFAVAAWFKAAPNQADAATTDNSIVEKWSGSGGYPYVIRYLNQTYSDHGHIVAARYDGTNGAAIQSTQTFLDERFHHVAFVKEGGTLYLYVDGALDGTAPDATTGDTRNTSPLFLGQRGNGGNRFQGLIDQAVVFDRALSASEVELLYAVGAQGRNWLDWQSAALSASGAGVTRTTWSHVVPADLDEDIYQIDLRGSDVLGNRNDDTSTWTQWKGEIDLHGPRVQVGFRLAGQFTDETARTEYTCAAEDFNLLEGRFECPCPVLPGDRQYYDTDWFRTWVSDTARLYRIETACIKPGHQPASTARVAACDGHGHCSEANGSAITVTSPLDSVVFTPTYGSVLTVTDPISIAGGAYAERTNGLKALTVTVDSAAGYSAAGSSGAIYTQTWAPGASYGEIWATTWLTLTEGVHILRAVVADHHGYVQTDTRPVTVYVDSQPPTIGLPSGVLTTAHRLMAGQLIVTGSYTETGGVASIQVKEADSAWGDASVLDEGSWRYTWFIDDQPDGVPYTLTARITDVAGRAVSETGVVTVDVTQPQAVTVTLAYTNSLGAYTVITPGQTIRDVLSPTLVITWTASDSSDVAHYYAGWSRTPARQIGDLAFYVPAERRHEQVAGEAQVHYAHVVGWDVHGNRRWQTVGPIYTDVPTTTDYVADLNYRGWMASGCSQIGADREVARFGQAGQALTGTQRFYATWHTDTLRLTWVGADWNNDGDLFVYFDAVDASGATVAHNPYTTTASGVITLPAQGGRQMAADYLVWVQDADNATLLAWDGGAWTEAVTDTLSGPPYYQLDTTLHPVHTDLALPFSWLGITETTPIKMVAFATEEDAGAGRPLRLWAAMPEKNPLNSEWAVNTLAGVEQIASGLGQSTLSYALTQQYEWDGLAPGLCPNAGQFTDADLLVEMSAEPAGVEVGYLAHDLLFLTPGQPLDADLDGVPDVPLPLDTDHGFIGEGMLVTYTVHYANEGTEVAPGVRVTATARGAVRLASDPLVLVLGDVDAGVSDTRQFTGVVDTSVYTVSGEVMAVVSDDVHGPFDWLWVQQEVDQAAPAWVKIEAPLAYIQPYTNTVRGAVYDPSGVPDIVLKSRLLPFGLWSEAACTDPTPNDGWWSCNWNVGNAENGDQFTLQVLATDRFGNGPTASAPVTLTVDTLPPTITLDVASEDALQGAVLGAGEQIILSGQVEDDQQAGGAEICIKQTDGQYCQQIALKAGATAVGDWRYALRAVGALDYQEQTLALTGIDGAGNRSTAPLSRTYTVDNVPPVLTVTTRIRHIAISTPTLVLSGAVYDGSGVSDVHVLATAPDGTLTSALAARDGGDGWRYILNADMEGVYRLRIEAWDAKGNVSGYGPYTVLAGITKVYLPLVLRK